MGRDVEEGVVSTLEVDCAFYLFSTRWGCTVSEGGGCSIRNICSVLLFIPVPTLWAISWGIPVYVFVWLAPSSWWSDMHGPWLSNEADSTQRSPVWDYSAVRFLKRSWKVSRPGGFMISIPPSSDQVSAECGKQNHANRSHKGSGKLGRMMKQ